MMLPLRIILCAGLVGLIVAATARQARSKATLIGRWEWVGTQLGAKGILSPASQDETTVLVYKADSTVDQYRNGVLVAEGRPFSVKRVPHPAGKGLVDVMHCPDETGFVEPYQTVWLKGPQSDTLVFMGLDPNDNSRPTVYSVFKRVE